MSVLKKEGGISVAEGGSSGEKQQEVRALAPYTALEWRESSLIILRPPSGKQRGAVQLGLRGATYSEATKHLAAEDNRIFSLSQRPKSWTPEGGK